MSELERSYRRLLRAYPGFYRRERGLEILTTLLDAAEPGQVRPSRVDVAHLLWSGLRYRFVPPTWIGRLATGLVTIWAALVLSGAGALVAWGVADPVRPDLGAVGDSLIGRPASDVYEVPDGNVLAMAYDFTTAGGSPDLAAEGWDGSRPAPMEQSRYYPEVPGATTVPADAHQRLTAEGWQTGVLIEGSAEPVGGDAGNGVFWASRDSALLRVSATAGPDDVMVSVFPAEPGGVVAGAIAGFVIGLMVVWQAMTWVAHRVVRTPPPTRRLILLLGLPALVACAVNTVDNVLSVLPGPGRVLSAADYLYPLANQLANPLAAGVVVLALALIGGARLAVRPAPESAAADRVAPEGVSRP